MPRRVWKVRSCSSESSVHRAENVLAEELYRIWQTKEPTEEAWILLEAVRPVAFDKLEIVNAGSYLVELYGLSEDVDEEDGGAFELLMSTQQVMSLKDLNSNSNRARVFTYSSPQKLSPVASQKRWKLLRFVCRQPFGGSGNKACIGLSRISIFPCSSEEIELSETEALQPVTDLQSRKNGDIDVESMSIGTKKRKLPTWNKVSKSSSEGSEQAVVEGGSDGKSKKPKKLFMDSGNSAGDTNGQKNLHSCDGNHAGDRKAKSEQLNDGVNATKKLKTESASCDKSTSVSSLKEGDADKGMLRHKNSPDGQSFSSVMDGIVFAISGLVNPERGNVRSQALAMGAQYQPDWNSQCTLLVCAFPNTPKFKQVKDDGGTIVSKEWITDCYKRRRLVDITSYLMHSGKPWRKYQSPNVEQVKENSGDGLPKSTTSRKNGKRPTGKETKMTRNDDYNGTLLSYKTAEIHMWAAEDLNKTVAWLQKQDNKPPLSEVKDVAIQGIITCLEDTITCMKEKQSLQKVLDSWECVPRAVKELTCYDDYKSSVHQVTKEELLQIADKFKSIYESEFKKLSRVNLHDESKAKTNPKQDQSGFQHKGRNEEKSKTGEKSATDHHGFMHGDHTGDNENPVVMDEPGIGDEDDNDSEDTIVMDEDEINQAELCSSY